MCFSVQLGLGHISSDGCQVMHLGNEHMVSSTKSKLFQLFANAPSWFHIPQAANSLQSSAQQGVLEHSGIRVSVSNTSNTWLPGTNTTGYPIHTRYHSKMLWYQWHVTFHNQIYHNSHIAMNQCNPTPEVQMSQDWDQPWLRWSLWSAEIPKSLAWLDHNWSNYHNLSILIQLYALQILPASRSHMFLLRISWCLAAPCDGWAWCSAVETLRIGRLEAICGASWCLWNQFKYKSSSGFEDSARHHYTNLRCHRRKRCRRTRRISSKFMVCVALIE